VYWILKIFWFIPYFK